MKRRTFQALAVIVLLAIILPTSVRSQDASPQESVSRSTTEFAVDLYRQFADQEKNAQKNLFFSPYSIYTVLALMYGGAAGETAEQIAAALHARLPADAFHAGMAAVQSGLNQIGEKGEVELNIANSLWPQSGAALKPQFLRLAERYLAEINPVDYRRQAGIAREQINAWAEDKTNGRIREIVNWTLDPETHLLLANAIYFKGDWMRQFDPAETEEMPFYRSVENVVTVPMMSQLGRFPFAWTDSSQILQLPYQGGDLSMIVVLPEERNGLPAMEERITAAAIASWQEELREQNLYVFLPRFRMTTEFELIMDGSLRALGIVRALEQGRAEFPGIGEPANWFSIQRFVHKAFVAVNEEGTEAAAVTVGGCFPAGTPVPTPGGLVPIEAIEPDTLIFAFDLNTGAWTTAPVAKRRTWPFSGQMVSIQDGGDTIEATWNHPFLVVRGRDLEARPVPSDLPAGEAVSTIHGRWVEARDILMGDELLVRGGGNAVVGGVESRRMSGEVYFLHIERHHNHAVGLQGVLVHNGGKPESAEATPTFKADHPFLFFIRDEQSGIILFMGRVTDPEEE